MKKTSKTRCVMCGAKIDPEKLVVYKDKNYCTRSCLDWYIETYGDKEGEPID